MSSPSNPEFDLPRILVCGGRDYTDWYRFLDVMEKVVASRDWHYTPDQYGNTLPRVIIISGGAQGADQMAIEWAVVNWCDFIEYPAQWDLHGRKAGPLRNQQMLDEGKPDLVVAFPGGRGTADMVRRARKAGVDVYEVK